MPEDGSGHSSLSLAAVAECPDQSPELQPWNPGHDEAHQVHIGQGKMLLLTSSATVHSIHITEGGEQLGPPLVPIRKPCREGLQAAEPAGEQAKGCALGFTLTASFHGGGRGWEMCLVTHLDGARGAQRL